MNCARAPRGHCRPAEAATQPTHPVAGQYHQGDGSGTNLTLDANVGTPWNAPVPFNVGDAVTGRGGGDTP
jgi:hypothetical protein